MVDLSEPFVERLDRVARVNADVQRWVVLIEDVIDGLALLVLAFLGQIGELYHKRARESPCEAPASRSFIPRFIAHWGTSRNRSDESYSLLNFSKRH